MTAASPEPAPAVTPGRYRKRPVTVDAVQWTGGNADEISGFTGRENFDVLDEQDRTNCDDPDATATVFDMLHSTWVLVMDGQWIIKGVKGEFYPCAADVFEATYEPADAPEPRLCACAHTAARHVAEGCMELDCGCTLPFRDIAQPQPAPPVTPGQAAYEAYDRAHGIRTPRANWRFRGPGEHASWEAAAQAAIDESDSTALAQLAMAQEAISDLAAERDEAREQLAAASHSAVYLNAIAILSAALRDIRDCTGTGTAGHDIAHKALDDVDHIRPPARFGPEQVGTIAGTVAGQIARERDEARAAFDEASTAVARLIAAMHEMHGYAWTLSDQLGHREHLNAILKRVIREGMDYRDAPELPRRTPGEALAGEELRAALEAVAAKWEAEIGDARPLSTDDARKAALRTKRICVRQLRQALGTAAAAAARDDREAQRRDAREDPF